MDRTVHAREGQTRETPPEPTTKANNFALAAAAAAATAGAQKLAYGAFRRRRRRRRDEKAEKRRMHGRIKSQRREFSLKKRLSAAELIFAITYGR